MLIPIIMGILKKTKAGNFLGAAVKTVVGGLADGGLPNIAANKASELGGVGKLAWPRLIISIGAVGALWICAAFGLYLLMKGVITFEQLLQLIGTVN